jgi:hypothetical protein
MFRKLARASLTLILSIASIFSQNTLAAMATGTSSATIVAPLSIAANLPLAFGKLDASGAAGTVVISAAGLRSKTGGVVLVTAGSVQGAASFDVTGTPSATYSISLPATAVTLTSGANSMTVGTFVSNPAAGGGGTLSAGGTETIGVGGTLNVGSAQAPGLYSGTFNVTVDYN